MTLRRALGGEKGFEGLLDGVGVGNGRGNGVNPEVLAARGAAEFAKRWLGMTWGCIEGEWCPDRENKEVL